MATFRVPVFDLVLFRRSIKWAASAAHFCFCAVGVLEAAHRDHRQDLRMATTPRQVTGQLQ
jgi:hypothetical protein